VAPERPLRSNLVLTAPNGTRPPVNCTNLEITSDVCETEMIETYHTWIHTPKDPELYVYKVDLPDPVKCGDTLEYKIFIANTGKGAAYNSVIRTL